MYDGNRACLERIRSRHEIIIRRLIVEYIEPYESLMRLIRVSLTTNYGENLGSVLDDVWLTGYMPGFDGWSWFWRSSWFWSSHTVFGRHSKSFFKRLPGKPIPVRDIPSTYIKLYSTFAEAIAAYGVASKSPPRG